MSEPCGIRLSPEELAKRRVATGTTAIQMTDDIETIVAKMKILGYNGVSIMVDEFGPGAVFYPIPHDGKIRDISRGNTIKGAVEKAAKATGVME